MTIADRLLVELATQARDRAIAPHSQFRVGASLLCNDGKIFTGCNIESSSYGLTICAERVAVFKALSEGERQFIRIVVVADTEPLTTPCGACRQVLWDFCGDIDVIMANLDGQSKLVKLNTLFPEPFGRHFSG
jgi:cytidine deaminase